MRFSSLLRLMHTFFSIFMIAKTDKRTIIGTMSSSNVARQHNYRPIANATPLGLLAFSVTTAIFSAGLVTVADNTRNSRLTIGFAFGFGGIVQLLAGLIELLRNNEFSGTAFSVYGGFWLSYGVFKVMESVNIFKADTNTLSFVAAVWALLTVILGVQTLVINRAIALLFANLTLFFFFLSAAEQTTSDSFLKKFTGGWGLWTSATGFYCAFAELTNETYQQQLVPIGNIGEINYGVAASPGKGENVYRTATEPHSTTHAAAATPRNADARC
jgi:uncharacterized protein